MTEAANDDDIIHRLKNHLAIIVGFAELVLQETAKNDPRRGDLEEIHKAAQEALAIMPRIARAVRGNDPGDI